MKRAIALLLALLPTALAAQQFPVVPDKTLIGRVGTGTGSGPAQAIPFATLFGSIPAGSLQLTALANIAAGTVLGNNTGSTGGVTATIAPVLGIPGTSAGSYCLANATSGTVCINPATGALGTAVATLPAGTYNIVGDSLTQTLTNKTFNCANNTCTVRLGSDVTGTLLAANFGALTGDVTNSAGSYATTIAAAAVTYAKMQNVAASRILGNPTGSPAAPSEISLDSTLAFSSTTLKCTTATSSQIGCAKPDGTTITASAGVLTAIGGVASSVDAAGSTSITNGVNGDCLGQTAGKISNFDCARLSVADQVLSGGATVTSLSQSSGNITIDHGARPLQYIVNTGAFTVTAPTSDGSSALRIANGPSAGAITFSGWSVGTNIGDVFATTVRETASCTATSASPAVFTYTAHGLPNNWPVYLTGTTAPTGFSLNTQYYTVSVATNTFQLSSTPGGSAINSSSTGTSITCNADSVYFLQMETIAGLSTYSWKALQ